MSKTYVFHGLVFQDMTTSKHYCQDLAATVCSRLGMPSFENVTLCCNSMPPSHDNNTIQDLAFQVFKLFDFPRPNQDHVFYDLVFEDMNRSETDCQNLVATFLTCFCNFMSALFKTWLSKS